MVTVYIWVLVFLALRLTAVESSLVSVRERDSSDPRIRVRLGDVLRHLDGYTGNRIVCVAVKVRCCGSKGLANARYIGLRTVCLESASCEP